MFYLLYFVVFFLLVDNNNNNNPSLENGGRKRAGTMRQIINYCGLLLAPKGSTDNFSIP